MPVITPASLKHYQFLDQLAALPFVQAIYLYGSRARGDHRERSDIDLAIVCPDASTGDWLQIHHIIDEADTLLEVDVLRYDSLSESADIKPFIDRDRVILYERIL